MQINQSNLAALYKGYRTTFLDALHGADPQSAAVAMETSSSSAEEIYHWLGAFPGMKELIGEITIENIAASKFAIVNKEFESTVGVKKADIERDTYGIYNPMFQAMGQAAGEHRDELVAALLSGGFTTTDYTGKNFFDTAKRHEPENNKSKTFTNRGTKTLAASSYSEAKTAIKSVKNAHGRPMGLGRKLTLIVSPANEDAAREILQAERDSSGATNIHYGTAELLVLDRLEGQPWFLMDSGRAVKPLIFQNESPVAFHSLTSETSDHVFKHKEFLYQAYGRYNAGYGLPQLIWGSNGTTAP